jgi:hypothetical protein
MQERMNRQRARRQAIHVILIIVSVNSNVNIVSIKTMYLLFVIVHPGADHHLKLVDLSRGDLKLETAHENLAHEEHVPGINL